VKRKSILTAVLFGTTAMIGWLVSRQLDLGAAEEHPRAFREAYSANSVSEDPYGVKLNFFDASWDKVLRHVADEYELTLVMDRIPPGRYARRDRSNHSFDQAIRILNSELEVQGYRLLRQKQFLIVLNLDNARTEYSRPRPAEATRATDESRAVALQKNFAQRTYHDDGRRSRRVPAQVADVRPLTQSGNTNTEFPQQGVRRDSVTTVAASRQVAVDAAVVLKTVSCQHTKAADAARSIYLVFQDRAELKQAGINGLPTFTVFDQKDENLRQVVFRIGIDQNKNELILEAAKHRLPHLTRLISTLDQPMEFGEETVRLLPNNGLSAQTADQLNEQIQQLLKMQQAEARLTRATGDLVGPDETADPPAEGQDPAADDEGTLNLRGDVNLQALQDLGILILQGNQADVDKVAAIIARLEDMSVGTVPDIHILTLTNISSVALAELLTSVYEDLTELRETTGQQDRKSAAFVAVVQPNALLIIASPLEMESIKTLATTLDVPLNPEFEFRVYPLKNAIASQVVTNLETFYADRGGLGVRVDVVADVRTNSLIIHGGPTELTEVGQLIEKIDRDDTGAVHRVQIFELKNAIADELATTINTAIQSVVNPPQQLQGGQAGGGGGFGGGGTQGAQELRDAKSVALEFLTTDGNARELIRSGIMVDVRVNADPRTNSLIVSAPEASMGLMAALIHNLDHAPSAIADVKIFTLKNADAEQSVALLETLFENQNQQDELGIQIAGAEDASSSLIPLQFSADIRTNSVLAVGSAEALGVVEAILLRLDTDDTRKRETTVIPLNNAPAELVADALSRFLEQQAALQDSTQDLISNIERLRQEVLVAEDTNSNSLIVSASPQYFSQITQIIDTLDATPPEVIIQALLVEVVLDQTDEFGIELGFQDPLLYSRSLLTAATTVAPGLNFNNTAVALGNPTAATATSGIVGTQGLSNFSLGRQNADLGFGGFVFSAQSDAVNVLLRALAARRSVHVLSRPQIRSTHNNQALVRVGQQVPIVNGVTITGLGIAQPQIAQQAVGIILQVTPRIRNDGVIAMDVYAEKSALSDNSVPIFVDGTTGNVINSPIIDQTIADTTVNVPNGQTIVIGGMITRNDASLETKVPWLGDLPLIGPAFRYDSSRVRRTELLIFLTPRIILGDVDSELIKQIESERMHFIESHAEEVHGPLYSVPHSDRALGSDPYCPPGESVGGAPMETDYLSPDLNLGPVEPQYNNLGRETTGANDGYIRSVSGQSAERGSAARRATWSRP
jgi:general secretion pathway protein D